MRKRGRIWLSLGTHTCVEMGNEFANSVQMEGGLRVSRLQYRGLKTLSPRFWLDPGPTGQNPNFE